ncbi:GNAT family N-acetyltransferase [Candidatus Hodarchaeum mangrovi]
MPSQPTSSNQDERKSVKLRRLFLREDTAKTISTELQKEKYKFIVMKMTFDQGLEAIENIKKIIRDDEYHSIIEIRNLKLDTDSEEFISLYNRSFITAPDPYRSLTYEDVTLFNEESTFVAKLYGRLVGFIFLTIEPLIKFDKEIGHQGVIAGIGVDPRYRRRKIAFSLAVRAAEYFIQNSVDELICEVFEENEVSINFIRSFGFQPTGEFYL